MRNLCLLLLLLSSLQAAAQGGSEDVSSLIRSQKYTEALARIRANATVGDEDLVTMVEWNNRTELLRKKPEGYATAIALIDSLVAKSKRLNKTGGGRTAIGHAISNGDSSLVRLLLERGVKPDLPVDLQSGYSAFQYAAYRYPIDPFPAERVGIMKMLYSAGANVSATTIKSFETHISHVQNVNLPRGVNALDIAKASGASQEAITYLQGLGLKETQLTK